MQQLGQCQQPVPYFSHHDDPTVAQTHNLHDCPLRMAFWALGKHSARNKAKTRNSDRDLVTLGTYCQATQADKSCCTTKLSVPKYILEAMGFFHVFFHSITDGFSNLLPMTYEILRQQAATATSKSGLLAYAQGESKSWTHPQSCSLEPAHTSDHFVCNSGLEARAMNVNRDRVLCQPKFHQN